MLKPWLHRLLLLMLPLSVPLFFTTGCQQLSNPGYTQRLQRLMEVSDTMGGGDSTTKPTAPQKNQ